MTDSNDVDSFFEPVVINKNTADGSSFDPGLFSNHEKTIQQSRPQQQRQQPIPPNLMQQQQEHQQPHLSSEVNLTNRFVYCNYNREKHIKKSNNGKMLFKHCNYCELDFNDGEEIIYIETKVEEQLQPCWYIIVYYHIDCFNFGPHLFERGTTKTVEQFVDDDLEDETIEKLLLLNENKKKELIKRMKKEKETRIQMVDGTMYEIPKEGNSLEIKWYRIYRRLVQYSKDNGNCNVTKEYSQQLLNWVITQRKKEIKNKLSNERKQLLDKIEFRWTEVGDKVNMCDRFDEMYGKLIQYKQKNANCKFNTVPPGKDENKDLEKFIKFVRRQKKNNVQKLTNDRIKKLDDIDFEWQTGEHSKLWRIFKGDKDTQSKAHASLGATATAAVAHGSDHGGEEEGATATAAVAHGSDHGGEEEVKKKRKKVQYDADGKIIKKAISGYQLYTKEMMTIVGENGEKPSLGKVAKTWKNLSDTEKSNWNTKAEALKPKVAREEWIEEVVVPQKKKPKRKKTGYNLYVSSVMKDPDNEKNVSEISASWKALSDKEKESYNDKAKQPKDVKESQIEKLLEDDNSSIGSPLKRAAV